MFDFGQLLRENKYQIPKTQVGSRTLVGSCEIKFTLAYKAYNGFDEQK